MDPQTIEEVTKIVSQHIEGGHTGLAATIASLVGVMLLREINYWMSRRKESRYANGGTGLVDLRNRVTDVDRHTKDISLTTKQMSDVLGNMAKQVEKFHDNFDDEQKETRRTLDSIRECTDRIERSHTHNRRRGE